ncbi:Golgi membrane protein 1 [Engraulis encrasicolus]|uniref:Golgi membrane protein 1 n=1 Tax=Engraulis encrasicolus TaxID=184585 RepID=UPI002FD1AD0A
MGALGNGRRVGRSPPLLIAALTTCILVLAFNYWVSNSRIAELQAQVYELEAHVRRGDAEREEVAEKWGEADATMKRQTQQIRELEEQHQREETTLHLNVSSCSKTVQDMKSQLKSLFTDLGKIQQELQTCQGSVNTLNKKLTYDTAQCNTQMMALKEDCEERMAAVKEAQKKQEKNIQTNAADTLKVAPITIGDQKVVIEDPANQTAEKSPKPSLPAESPDVTELKTNDIVDVHDGTKLKFPCLGLIKLS